MTTAPTPPGDELAGYLAGDEAVHNGNGEEITESETLAAIGSLQSA